MDNYQKFKIRFCFFINLVELAPREEPVHFPDVLVTSAAGVNWNDAPLLFPSVLAAINMLPHNSLRSSQLVSLSYFFLLVLRGNVPN